MAATLLQSALGILLLLAPAASAFYIPGYSVTSYQRDEPMPLMVNKVYSDNTQLQYAYFDLPFVCPPTGAHRAGGAGGLLSGESVPLNLGEVLRGDRIMASDLQLAMLHDTPCATLCTRDITLEELIRAQEMIEEGYVAEWIVDNLPGATSFVTVDKTKKYYAAGFKLGYDVEVNSAATPARRVQYFLNNHHTIVIRYRRAPGRAGDRGEKVVVGFEVYPKSVGYDASRNEHGCPADLKNVKSGLELTPNKTASAHDDDPVMSIPYTYSVYFREDETIEWAHRWDLYFVNQDEGSHIHWLAIVNSLIICALLTGVVMIILAKTIRSDIKTYKDAVAEDGKIRLKKTRPASTGLLDQPHGGDDDDMDLSDEEALEDITGWKLLHADVFRTPAWGGLLAPLVGSGVQLFVMAMGLITLSTFGVLNPSFRGGFISVGVGLFIFAGLFSGYFSARVFKSFEGRGHRRNALVTALLVPGIAFCAVFVLNLFVWAQASSTAMPFSTLLAIMALWLCVQVPLVYAGSHHGYHKAPTWEHPTKTTGVPRPIPRQSWLMHPVVSGLLYGLIPFAVIFIELLYVFQSLWQDKSGYYYVFGFLAVVCVLLTVTIAEVTVVSVYARLCAEDHRWWWHSFVVGGGSSIWVFAYCVWYYLFKLHITGFVSGMLFFAYSGLACCVYGLLTGTVGFLSAYAFVRRIYGAIKAD
ncbi:endomembrane protein 70 [Emericellopsis atlantica]|uniref:Transmembrane 9 superfamily member n=1 Tax=Emericellopsis atlantica TaxID=2614577 RepID=A0A9P8CQY4_9HYPO|nr:endomembrane protein 70 [Emericellopsis atlantica]KAG9256439.1 endomembrane protein 70 [Emericellopsis atlantica]